MLNLNGIDTVTRAQNLLTSTAQRIAQESLDPKDVGALLQAREQFTAGVKVTQIEDEMNRKLLDVLA